MESELSKHFRLEGRQIELGSIISLLYETYDDFLSSVLSIFRACVLNESRMLFFYDQIDPKEFSSIMIQFGMDSLKNVTFKHYSEIFIDADLISIKKMQSKISKFIRDEETDTFLILFETHWLNQYFNERKDLIAYFIEMQNFFKKNNGIGIGLCNTLSTDAKVILELMNASPYHIISNHLIKNPLFTHSGDALLKKKL